MPGLKVLDLSFTRIESLPASLCGLVNLTALLLSHCAYLRKFPAIVGYLRALKKLDLNCSAVEQVAEDIVMPEKLTYLDLYYTRLKSQPQILAQVSRLQFLRLPSSFVVKGQEVACLSRLETLTCCFDDLVDNLMFTQDQELCMAGDSLVN
ncbi:hypothetical protein M5689_025208 [Euphorbia peplus]|nr:hypothetical protein M5689_025208 [Euphorbia peplus]